MTLHEVYRLCQGWLMQEQPWLGGFVSSGKECQEWGKHEVAPTNMTEGKLSAKGNRETHQSQLANTVLSFRVHRILPVILPS